MSAATAKTARAAMKAKAERLASGGDKKVDASSYRPEVFEQEQTGKKPQPRKYKAGGAVVGTRTVQRADRTVRVGNKSHYNTGGAVPPKRMNFGSNVVTPGQKDGGRVADHGKVKDGPVDKEAQANAFKKGGRSKRKRGGLVQDHGKVNDGPVAKAAQKAAFKKGGEVDCDDDVKKGVGQHEKKMHPNEKRTKLRLERARGGRAKGKTNINIHINQPPAAPAGDPPGLVRGPTPRPAAPIPVGPPGMAAGAPMPPIGGPPPAMPPMGGPPGGLMPPGMPMPRKRGGRVGKRYRSAADMDAGAGSGKGRLEKSEIQAAKH